MSHRPRVAAITSRSRPVLLALVLGLVLGACSADAGASPEQVAATAEAVEFEIELGDLWVQPEQIEAPAGAPVVLHVTNVGQLPHDLKIGDSGTRILGAGESETVTVGPFGEPARLVCTVPGHQAAGMVLDLHVE